MGRKLNRLKIIKEVQKNLEVASEKQAKYYNLRRRPIKGFSNKDITISYFYMNAPLNFFNELSMSKR